MSRELRLKESWWLEAESNHRHTDFQSVALPTELSSRLVIEKTKYTGVFPNTQLNVEKFSDLKKFWWLEAESNHRHTDFQSVALPTELSSRLSIEKLHYTGLLKKNLAVVLRGNMKDLSKAPNTEIMCPSGKAIKYCLHVSNTGVPNEL